VPKKNPDIEVTPSADWKGRAWFVLSSAAIGLAVAGVVIVFLLVFRSGNGGSGATATPPASASLDIPSPIATQPATHSAAADVLANKTLDSMTAADLDLVKSEIARAYQNVIFRASSGLVPAIDIYRIDGHTRVSRQFNPGAAPNKDVTVQTLVFYCDAPDGNIAAYGYNISPGDVRSASSSIKAHTQPFDALISGLDWSQAKDLGFRTIAGHRTHGFEMPFASPATGKTTTARDWFDVESARIIENEQPEGGDQAAYTFDWSLLPPIEVPAGQPIASCADAFYASVPSARPPQNAASTPIPSATP